MNPDLAFEILDLAISLTKSYTHGEGQQDVTVAGTLVQIVKKGTEAYEQHTGEPLDPALIKPEPPV